MCHFWSGIWTKYEASHIFYTSHSTKHCIVTQCFYVLVGHLFITRTLFYTYTNVYFHMKISNTGVMMFHIFSVFTRTADKGCELWCGFGLDITNAIIQITTLQLFLTTSHIHTHTHFILFHHTIIFMYIVYLL